MILLGFIFAYFQALFAGAVTVDVTAAPGPVAGPWVHLVAGPVAGPSAGSLWCLVAEPYPGFVSVCCMLLKYKYRKIKSM